MNNRKIWRIGTVSIIQRLQIKHNLNFANHELFEIYEICKYSILWNIWIGGCEDWELRVERFESIYFLKMTLIILLYIDILRIRKLKRSCGGYVNQYLLIKIEVIEYFNNLISLY